MDWKIPATIVILTFIVSLGLIPFFSPEFSTSIGGILDSFKNLLGNLPSLFEKEKKFNGSIKFSLSTKEFDNLKIGIPANIHVDVEKEYKLKVDKKNLILKEDFDIYNFTGLVALKDFLISGECFKISTKNFEIEGKSKVMMLEKNFESLLIKNLKIGELTLDNGNISIESPQKISAELDNKIKLHEFQGDLMFENSTITLEGNCSKIETEGFSFGE
jgi:uncharacterized protein YxjI